MLAVAVCVMNITLGSALAIFVLYVRDRLGRERRSRSSRAYRMPPVALPL